MQALSSRSRTAYVDCLNFLSGMPTELLDGQLYCAVAGSCSHYGMVEGVNAVFEAMRQRGFEFTSSALTSLLYCYANLKPPRELLFEPTDPPVPVSAPGTRTLHLDTPEYASSSDVDSPYDAASLPTFAQDADVTDDNSSMLQGYSDADSNIAFYSMSLSKVMSVWKEFEYLDLPVNGRGYAAVVRAHMMAGKHELAEAFLVEMVDRGIPHSDITASLWIESHLIRNDASRALQILEAVGNPTRCAELALEDRCFDTLGAVPRTGRQFSVIIRHYLFRGDISTATAMMGVMHKCKIKTSSKLYVEILRRLAHDGNHDAFVDIMQQMVAVDASIDAQVMDTIREYSSHRKALTASSADDDDS
ncbi:hypothetical protein IWW38_005612 [Coemansia aciculifera]|uniref:Uncharacterized protein n=1 Tax=Coemansia aciculifera TaxID=417176 RepID=A0ACC1LW46_9FUNG|nr:hypothetical protein IWW38_005612 [Coemansia aciculifera]